MVFTVFIRNNPYLDSLIIAISEATAAGAEGGGGEDCLILNDRLFHASFVHSIVLGQTPNAFFVAGSLICTFVPTYLLRLQQDVIKQDTFVDHHIAGQLTPILLHRKKSQGGVLPPIRHYEWHVPMCPSSRCLSLPMPPRRHPRRSRAATLPRAHGSRSSRESSASSSRTQTR